MVHSKCKWRVLIAVAGLVIGPVAYALDHRQIVPYNDPSLPFATRVDDLLSRMTLEEKIGQLRNDTSGVDRLGIQAFDWWNECLHGVAAPGFSTVFPQAIGLCRSATLSVWIWPVVRVLRLSQS